jgi:hypothetical protein
VSLATDFYDWKKHPVTQEVFSQLRARADYLKDEIINQVGGAVDPRQLALKAGMVQAFEFLLNIDYEESHGN